MEMGGKKEKENNMHSQWLNKNSTFFLAHIIGQMGCPREVRETSTSSGNSGNQAPSG